MRRRWRVLVDLDPPVFADALAGALRAAGYRAFGRPDRGVISAAVTDRSSRTDIAPIVLCLRHDGRISVHEGGESGFVEGSTADDVVNLLDHLLRSTPKKSRPQR